MPSRQRASGHATEALIFDPYTDSFFGPVGGLSLIDLTPIGRFSSACRFVGAMPFAESGCRSLPPSQFRRLTRFPP